MGDLVVEDEEVGEDEDDRDKHEDQLLHHRFVAH